MFAQKREDNVLEKLFLGLNIGIYWKKNFDADTKSMGS
jgi:hypothetical protein